MLLEKLQDICREAVKSRFDVEVAEVSIDFPDKFGDLCMNCFYLARDLRQAPPKIAAALADHLNGVEFIEAAEATSGYVNFTIRRDVLMEAAVAPVLAARSAFGTLPADDNSPAIMVEFSAPNTNKPQHLGHVRNNCLGDSLSRILSAAGNKVLRANLINDRGIHICKSMLAYQREGSGATPTSVGKKGDHFVGDYYVLFETRFQEEWKAAKETDSSLVDLSKDEFFKISQWGMAAQTMLQEWEAGDEETVALWKQMNEWVIDGFNKTYESLGISFDKVYLESEQYLFGKEIILDGLERDVFYRREDGAIECDLSVEKLDRKVVLRSDGTSVYITQDIGTTVNKAEDFGLSGQVFVVGNEQIYHFKVLFSILEKLGYSWAGNLTHLAYGMVNLPDGKMKSREGKVVDADDIIAEVAELAAAEIRSREPDLDADELATRSQLIGLAALKFMILGVQPTTGMMYDPKKSVQFDGETGPYVLYAYARIQRMLTMSEVDLSEVEIDYSCLVDEHEIASALRLLAYPGCVQRAARDSNPAMIATYLLQLARSYHSMNRAVLILKAADPTVRQARLALSQAIATTIHNGLGLLGITPVDRM